MLLDVLGSGKVNLTKAMTAEEIDKDRALVTEMVSFNSQIANLKQEQQPDRAQIAALETQLTRSRLEYESFQTSLYAAHPELRAQRGQPQPGRPHPPRGVQPNAPGGPPPPPPALDTSQLGLQVTYYDVPDGNGSARDVTFSGPVPNDAVQRMQEAYADAYYTTYPGEIRMAFEDHQGSSEKTKSTFSDSANKSKGGELHLEEKSPFEWPSFGGKGTIQKGTSRTITTDVTASPELERRIDTGTGLAMRNDRAIYKIEGMSFRGTDGNSNTVTDRIGPYAASQLVSEASKAGQREASRRAQIVVAGIPPIR
jgi:hypothetical protein